MHTKDPRNCRFWDHLSLEGHPVFLCIFDPQPSIKPNGIRPLPAVFPSAIKRSRGLTSAASGWGAKKGKFQKFQTKANGFKGFLTVSKDFKRFQTLLVGP